jgi:hypothetical protein
MSTTPTENERGKKLSTTEALVASSPRTIAEHKRDRSEHGELAAFHGATMLTMGETMQPFSPVQHIRQPLLPDNQQGDLFLPEDNQAGSVASLRHDQQYQGNELARPLIDRQAAARPQPTAGCPLFSWRTLLIAAFVLVATYEYIAKHHMHAHDGQSHHTSIPEAHRDTTIWECAEQLSGNAAFLDKVSPRKLAVQEFLAVVASEVDISGECSWQSAFGIIYGILVLRESLAVAHPSWQPVHKLIGPLDVCHWAGIKCNLREDVQGIFLNNANLTGTVPREIAGFAKSLTTLHLFSNDNVIGTLPHEMGELSNLEILYLHETNIAGSIPPIFGSLANLKELLLDHTHLTGTMPQEVCDLRLHHLNSLHADCLGPHAKVQCSTLTCCTSCH